jgi:hypothetical protein
MYLMWSVTTPCLLYLLHILYSILLLHHSSSMLCSYSSCAQHLCCSASLSSFYTLCCLCMLFTVPHISPSYYALCLILPTCITIEKDFSLLCSACISHTKFSTRSSPQLFVFSGGYSEYVHHQWLLSKYSLASLAVITLHILFQLQPVILSSLASKRLPSRDH